MTKIYLTLEDVQELLRTNFSLLSEDTQKELLETGVFTDAETK